MSVPVITEFADRSTSEREVFARTVEVAEPSVDISEVEVQRRVAAGDGACDTCTLHLFRDDPEAEEPALIYRAKGLDAQEAERVAATIMKDQETALETMAREELGLDPEELGSPWSAALSSLVAFALGAVVVVLPYLFGSGTAALVTAVCLAAAALFAVGSALGLLNGRAALRAGSRQLLVGGGAALLVFFIGQAIGSGSV